ncbi:hypothetical protein U9M48_013802 [Paspalum notatum var. saurae]|uniref:Uncharacterized protein n=1 Tax=Paspalum notatum var. saurae TaxID=547442 RepID=A0AAQ3T158_PASNO
MMHSNACNCPSLQTSPLLFCNALETRDLLGITTCFDTRHTVDSRREAATNRAFTNSLTSLHSSLSEVVFLVAFLNWVSDVRLDLGLGACLVSPPENNQQILNGGLQLGTARLQLQPQIRDHLGISICFDKRHDVYSSTEVVIDLASASSLTTLQSLSSEVVFLQTFLSYLDECLELSSYVISSFECQEKFLYDHLQFDESFLHGVAEGLAEVSLVAWCANHLLNATVEASSLLKLSHIVSLVAEDEAMLGSAPAARLQLCLSEG